MFDYFRFFSKTCLHSGIRDSYRDKEHKTNEYLQIESDIFLDIFLA